MLPLTSAVAAFYRDKAVHSKLFLLLFILAVYYPSFQLCSVQAPLAFAFGGLPAQLMRLREWSAWIVTDS